MTAPWIARLLLRLAVAAFLAFGAVSFVAPGWASEQFPWKTGPFVTMTIGGWALGTAGVGWLASRESAPALTYPLVVYLAVFSVGELLVAAVFANRLRLDAPLTYPYLGALLLTALGAASKLADWARRRDPLRGRSGRAPAWVIGAVGLFVMFVGLLCAITATAGPDGMAARGLVVPEAMGLFSIRAFTAFFLAIALASLSLLATRDERTYDAMGRAGLVLLLPITAAALANIGLFDPVARPASFVYLGAYVFVGTLLGLRVVYVRRSR